VCVCLSVCLSDSEYTKCNAAEQVVYLVCRAAAPAVNHTGIYRRRRCESNLK